MSFVPANMQSGGPGLSPHLLSSLSSTGRNAMSVVADAAEQTFGADAIKVPSNSSSPNHQQGVAAGIAQVASSGAALIQRQPSVTASSNTGYSTATIERILTWQNYSTTLLVISAVDSVFLLVWLLAVPLLSLSCILGVGLMTVGLALSAMLDTVGIFEKPLVVISKTRLEEALPGIYNTITNTACKGRDILLWRHTATSAWSTACMIIVGYLASLVQFSVLCFLAVNLLFFYRQLKSLYDAHLAVFVSMGCDYLHHYWERIPKMKKKEHTKLS